MPILRKSQPLIPKSGTQVGLALRLTFFRARLIRNAREMNGAITQITLTSEQFGDLHPDLKYAKTDVIVRFENGDEFVCAFSSFDALEAMVNERKRSKDYFTGAYYEVLNTVLVNNFNRQNLLPVIEQMIDQGDFQIVFRKV